MKTHFLPEKGKRLHAPLPGWRRASYILQKYLQPLTSQTIDDVPGLDLDKCFLAKHTIQTNYDILKAYS